MNLGPTRFSWLDPGETGDMEGNEGRKGTQRMRIFSKDNSCFRMDFYKEKRWPSK